MTIDTRRVIAKRASPGPRLRSLGPRPGAVVASTVMISDANPPTTLKTAIVNRTLKSRFRSSVRWSTSDMTLPSSAGAAVGTGFGAGCGGTRPGRRPREGRRRRSSGSTRAPNRWPWARRRSGWRRRPARASVVVTTGETTPTVGAIGATGCGTGSFDDCTVGWVWVGGLRARAGPVRRAAARSS